MKTTSPPANTWTPAPLVLGAYCAWTRRERRDGIVVFAFDEADAVSQAFRLFAYSVRGLAMARCGPRDLVRVVRAPELDHYANGGLTPELTTEAVTRREAAKRKAR